jgi:hypothetical protein
MKKLIFALVLFAGCGSENPVKFPSQDGCHPWVQVEWNWCGGTWIKACMFGEMKCVYSWSCGYTTGPSCK